VFDASRREIRNKPGFLPQATWLIAFGRSPEELQWCGTIQGVVDRGGCGLIQNIGIVPGHRGIGLGTCLIEQALLGFRQHGLRTASLEVTADNGRAVRLYQRLGFRRVRTAGLSGDSRSSPSSPRKARTRCSHASCGRAPRSPLRAPSMKSRSAASRRRSARSGPSST
jgi:N-acetylglutamate synthase-like GNAT family acetyltransferase